MPSNFGDFQIGVYLDATKGPPRDTHSTPNRSRKASEALPDSVYRYVSAAAGDGRTQRANIAAYSRYGITPRMMISPPERDLSITLFDKHLESPIFMWPIGLIGLCAPDFQGDIAAARAANNDTMTLTVLGSMMATASPAVTPWPRSEAPRSAPPRGTGHCPDQSCRRRWRAPAGFRAR